MQEKHFFITYREGSYNEVTRTYDPIDQIILEDPRVKDSMIFDTNRRTIYVQGYEFGNSQTFAYTYQGTGLIGRDLSKDTAYFITGIIQDIDGSITYSYSYSYTTHNTSKSYIETIPNDDNGTYLLTGVAIDNNGDLSYTYTKLIINQAAQAGTLTYLENENVTGTNKDHHSYLVTWMYKNPNEDDKVTFTYTDISTNTGLSHVFSKEKTQSNGQDRATILNNTTYRFLTNISQTGDGKISYTYADFNTYHYSTGNTNNAHNLPTIANLNLSADGVLSYKYVNLTLGNSDKSKSDNTYLDLSRNEYNVIDGISQLPDGKITYTYRTLKTTHNTSNSYVETIPNDDDGTYLLTGVGIDNNGDLSYTYTKLIINQSAQAGTLTYLEGNDVTNKNTYHTYGVTWMYKDGENSDKVTFAYTDLTTDSGTKTLNSQYSNTGSNIMLYNTAYRFITNVSQSGDGKISYTYADFRTTHSTNAGNVLSAESLLDHIEQHGEHNYDTGGVITGVNLSASGNLSYNYKNLGAVGTYRNEYTISNNESESPEFIYDLIQYSDGSISYNTRKLKTKITHASDNVIGVVYEVNVNDNGEVISYAHKNLTTNSGTNNGTKKLHNGSTYNFITSVSQDAYGKLSYEYITLENSFDNNGSANGVITNVHIDNTGKLSYNSANLKNDSGTWIRVRDVSNRDNFEIIPDKEDDIGVNLITGISQAPNGQISYTYSNLFTDKENYKYHDLKLTGSNIGIMTGNVKVIAKLDIDSQGNNSSHTISYTYTQVPTRQYVDALITANDAMRYCGTFYGANHDINSDSNDFSTLVLNSNNNNLDTSCGAVYKCSVACKIQGHTFSVGDWIMSNKDDASPDDLTDGWDTFNVNITINSVGNKSINQDEGTYILTNVYADDTGTLSYTYQELCISNTKSNVRTSKTSENNKSENILLNETNPKGFRVITDVNLSQKYLGIDLSYTYTYLYVDQKHHGTNTYTATPVSTLDTNYVYVVTGVSLSADGQLSYCITPYNVSDSSHAGSAIGLDAIVHTGDSTGVITNMYVDSNNQNILTYNVKDLTTTSGTHTYNRITKSNLISGQDITLTNDYAYRFITNISQDTYGKISYDYAFLNTYTYSIGIDNYSQFGMGQFDDEQYLVGNDEHHIYGHVLVNVSLDANGKLSYTYLRLGNDTEYRYTWNTIHGAVDNTFSKWHDPINLTGTYFDIISYVGQSYNGKIYPITETFYTYFWSNATNDAGASKVIGAVYLGNNGNLQYAYTDIAQATYHYAVTTNTPSTSTPDITININGTTTTDLVAYSGLTNDAKGHLTGSTKPTYKIKHGAANTSGSAIAQKALVVPYDGNNGTDDFYSYKSITTNNGHITGYVTTSYVLKHGSVTTTTSTDSATITIPINGSSTDSLTAYNNATTGNGHLTGLTKTTYTIKHGEANTSGSVIAQKTLTIPYNPNGLKPTSDEFVSYKSITTNNGHITSYVRTSYVLKHEEVYEKVPENLTFDKAGMTVISEISRENGHITGINTTTITDENVKFVKDTSNKIYIGGTTTSTGNVTTNDYIDGVAYINNGTLYETNIQVGTDLSVGRNATIAGNTTLGDASTDIVTLNAAKVTLPASATKIDFTNLQALWGIIS